LLVEIPTYLFFVCWYDIRFRVPPCWLATWCINYGTILHGIWELKVALKVNMSEKK
jgi:hypothetical protein